jgi:GH15 family glucan-1,4-alpha-glucosidase
MKGTYPPIADFGLIGDCHSAALVSRAGSIDWCCLPRFDSGSCFGRLLDWERGGYCSVAPMAESSSTRAYVDGSLVLETVFRTATGEARLRDFFAMREGGRQNPRRQIVRILEGTSGSVDARIEVAPRFDYGEVRPWIRAVGKRAHLAIGGSDGMLVWSDADLAREGQHDLSASVRVRGGERVRLSLQYVRPELADDAAAEPARPHDVDELLEETLDWWRRWGSKGNYRGPHHDGLIRSAAVLKALTHAPTGAMVAAPTTSLPEVLGGDRNWDYRLSWIRDSTLAARALTALGHDAEADGFRRFIERSVAGTAEELQILFGVGGERRMIELPVESLRGYRRSPPVRVGNQAYRQQQHDVYGQVLDLAWEWHQRGHSPRDDHWEFLVEVVDLAARLWARPDRGIWEVRSRPQHFVHSKVMSWTALDRGIRLAEDIGWEAPVRRWRRVRRDIERAVERQGYQAKPGVFVRSFGSTSMDAALLLLPRTGFVAYDDDRMIRTVDAIREELDVDGLLRRYRVRDGLGGKEGAFVPASFWLAECLARQGRTEEARAVFERASSAGNDLGLFSEEYDVGGRQMLGNFPQGLSHLSHIMAALAVG